MQYNTIELINYILLSIYINYVGTITYNVKPKLNKKQIISILVLIILLTLIKKYYNNLYVFFFFFILCIIYYKINYKNNTYLILYSTLITILSLLISNFILVLFLNHSKYINLLSIIVSIILITILKKPIKLLTNTNINIAFLNYLLLNSYIIYTTIKVKLEKETIQNIISMIILSTFFIILIIQEQKIEKLKRENKELQKYAKTGEQTIISYRKNMHEYKNKLIIIKSMIKPTNKELFQYVDYLIDENINIKNKWLNEIKDIPFPGIKNFINYKLNILEENKAKIELFVSEELSKINPATVDIVTINNLNTIIGVMLDNIIDSIEKTTEKLVSINIYIDKNSIHVLLANNFENDIDLTKINKVGYSTKGNKRGIGLSLVNDIIKTSKNLELESKIEENFFIQHLKIKNINKYLK